VYENHHRFEILGDELAGVHVQVETVFRTGGFQNERFGGWQQLEGMTGTALLGGVSNPVPASRGLRRLESQLPERRPRVGDSHETDKRSAQDVDFALSSQLSLLDRTNQIHLCERKCCTMRLIKYELFLLNTIICVAFLICTKKTN
jgi:hypothetical protein